MKDEAYKRRQTSSRAPLLRLVSHSECCSDWQLAQISTARSYYVRKSLAPAASRVWRFQRLGVAAKRRMA